MSSTVSKDRDMAVPRDVLYKVITDFNSYPEFVTEVVGVKVLPAGKATQQVQFELEVVKRFQYTLEFEFKKGEEVAWKLIESNFFKTNSGRWILKDSAKGRTHATYELDVSFGFLVPGWISRKLTETNLPKMLENFEKRAMSVMSGSNS